MKNSKSCPILRVNKKMNVPVLVLILNTLTESGAVFKVAQIPLTNCGAGIYQSTPILTSWTSIRLRHSKLRCLRLININSYNFPVKLLSLSDLILLSAAPGRSYRLLKSPSPPGNSFPLKTQAGLSQVSPHLVLPGPPGTCIRTRKYAALS